MNRSRNLVWMIPSLVLAAGAACSSSTSPNNGFDNMNVMHPDGSAGAGGAGQAGNFNTGNTGGSGASSGAGGASGGTNSTCGTGVPATFKMCGGMDVAVEDLPVDLFFMLDQSTSMDAVLPNGRTRWLNVTDALSLYLMNGLPPGSRAGMQYFGLGGMAGCNMQADGGPPNWSQCAACNVAQYNSAAVPIQPIASAVPAIVASIGMHGPSTFTPTGAAVQGGLQFASAWAAQNLDHITMFVLVTDGFPTQCDVQDIGGIANMAGAAAMGNPPVKTVVVGVGDADANLNAIAVKGGSKQAIIVSDTSGDVTATIVDKLSKLSHTPLGCSYPIPKSDDGGLANPMQVNVTFTPSGADPTLLCALDGSYQCVPNGGGWYYDDPTSPKNIIICPNTCDNFSAGTLKMVVGCQRVPPTK